MKQKPLVGQSWVDSKGHKWNVVENLYFGIFRVVRDDRTRCGEMQGKAIRSKLSESKQLTA